MTKLQKTGLVSASFCFLLFIVSGFMFQGTPKVWNGEEAVVVGGPGYERGVLLVSVVPIEPEKKPAPTSWYVKATCSNPFIKKGDKVRLYTKQIWAKPEAILGEVF